ncbi:MAG TPA: hypothetical protein VK772_00845 [Puia sp.]|jgi:hypothetical protein|nr:hypothetical protein [Puia sp.]
MTNQTMTSKGPGAKSSVVLYQLKGKDYVRSAPKLFKTLNIENAKGYQLTLAYLISKTIRQHLHSIIPHPSDVEMQNLLRTEVLEYVSCGCKDSDAWITHASLIDDFRFSNRGLTENNKWVSKIRIRRKSSRRLEIKIPSFVPAKSIQAPWHTYKVLCKIAISVCYRKTGASVDNIVTEFGFPFDNVKIPALTIPLELKTPKMSIVITGLGMKFRTTHKYALHKEEADKCFQSAIIHTLGV